MVCMVWPSIDIYFDDRLRYVAFSVTSLGRCDAWMHMRSDACRGTSYYAPSTSPVSRHHRLLANFLESDSVEGKAGEIYETHLPAVMPSDWLYRCPPCGFCHETWEVCHQHMQRCCPHLLSDGQTRRKRKARHLRVPNSDAVAARLKARAEEKRRLEAEAEIKASMPFLCAYGCGEGYETRDRCDRHEQVCARGVAFRCRHQKRQAPLKSVPQGRNPPAAVGYDDKNGKSSEAAIGAVHKATSVPDYAARTAAISNTVPATMAFGAVQQVPNQVNFATSEEVRSTYSHSPYPQLPEQFGSYNCLLCSRGYTGWFDCVAHMVGCCNQLYEYGKLWGGVEAVRIRCGVEEPGSKKCTHCGSFKSKQDFESTEWAEIGKTDRNRQCKECLGSIK